MTVSQQLNKIQATVKKLQAKVVKLQTKIDFFIKAKFSRRAIAKAILDQVKIQSIIDRLNTEYFRLAERGEEKIAPEPVTTFNKKTDKKVFKMFVDRLQENPRVIESGERVLIAHRNGEVSIIGSIELPDSYFGGWDRKKTIRGYQNAFNSKQCALFEAIGQVLVAA